MDAVQTKSLKPTSYNQSILLFQSKYSRALNVGFIQGKTFIPGRLHFGTARMADTLDAMQQTFSLPQFQQILKKFDPIHISTVTVIREALAYQLPQALHNTGTQNYFGDAFVGATHKKDNGPITTLYGYENTEGLVPDGLWIIGDSICMGRNLEATINSLLEKYTPKEIIFVCPIASRIGIEKIGKITAEKNIPTSFFAWGALFGVGENLYDMPWGHPDTESLDERDQKVFVDMYNDTLCVGGDFGNDYFSPTIAKAFYDQQIQELGITPKIPDTEAIQKIYTSEEILVR